MSNDGTLIDSTSKYGLSQWLEALPRCDPWSVLTKAPEHEKRVQSEIDVALRQLQRRDGTGAL